MDTGENSQCVFPLTSLQIGDLQSYRSHLSLFVALESNKFLILVDNRPWLSDLDSRAAHLWQLMVTKSRLSPFANTRARRKRKEGRKKLDFEGAAKSSAIKPNKFKRWFDLADAATLSHRRDLLPVKKLDFEGGKKLDFEDAAKSSTIKPNKFKRWFDLANAATLSHRRDLLPVKKLRDSVLLNSELHRTLYGFIIFEVAWTDVRGINYLNELQTDTSLGIEAKFMKRWEFDSIQQALSCISSWFLGTHYEQLLLREYLDSILGEVFYDAQESFSPSNCTADGDNILNVDKCVGEKCNSGLSGDFSVFPASVEYETSMLQTQPSLTGPYKRRKIMKSVSSRSDTRAFVEEVNSEIISSPTHLAAAISANVSDGEDTVEPTQYRDILILSRFNDRDLPFKLKEIIVSDLRLLTLLESGLPSWVIFVQSYPVFCHLYRPWMCPLVRALYVLISVVTVLIGFYDLYKNVPVLKATASRICGPLFDWIENWEMITRIKYLGTMLFLHNFEKAVKWFLMVTRAIRSFTSVITQPMAGPLMDLLDILLPFWNLCFQAVDSFCSVVWIATESFCSFTVDIGEVLLSPLWFVLSVIWNIASSIIYPIFWTLWEILYTPVRVVLTLARLVAWVFSCMFDLLGDIWLSVNSLFQIASASEATVSTYQVSIWRSLWNDLFSQVFRAIRSIVNGFVAFFTACNRHRLSIYNHILEFFRRLSHDPHLSQRSISPDSSHHRRACGAQEMLELKRRGSHRD